MLTMIVLFLIGVAIRKAFGAAWKFGSKHPEAVGTGLKLAKGLMRR